MSAAKLPAAAQVLVDPAASDWIKAALRAALKRDPVDAANDAALLADILTARVTSFGEPS